MDDDPLDAERRKAEDQVAKILYRHWARQFDLLKTQLEAVRLELLAAQQMAAEQQPLRIKQAIDVTLDWGEEEAALQADLGTLLDELVAGAVVTMQDRYRRMGVKLSWEQWDAQAAEWARQYRYTLIKDLTDSTRKQLGQTISDWIATDADFAELVSQVRKIVPPNKLPMIRDRARVVAQTETTRVYAESRMMGMQEAGLTHMVWQTANDELVCLRICAPLHGQVGTINQGVINPANGQAYKPPGHVGCRCWLTESADEMMELVQRSGGPEEDSND